MKYICKISHHVPIGDGKFIVYEAGVVYDLPIDEPGPYFRAVETKIAPLRAIRSEEIGGGLEL